MQQNLAKPKPRALPGSTSGQGSGQLIIVAGSDVSERVWHIQAKTVGDLSGLAI